MSLCQAEALSSDWLEACVYGAHFLNTYRRKLLLLVEWVVIMAVFTKIILVCLLFQCRSFASGPVFEADTFHREQREGKAVCIHSLTQRDAPYP